MTAASTAPVPGALPTKRDVEHALLALGMTRRQAKTLISSGYNAVSGDDPLEDLTEAAQRFVARLRGTP